MKRRLIVPGIILTFAAFLYAQDKTAVKINGYLIDNACVIAAAKDKDVAARVKRHPTSCALTPNCLESGFSVFSEGKFYKLDEAGNKSATEVMKNTKTTSGVEVAVEGILEGDTLNVTKLAEVTKNE